MKTFTKILSAILILVFTNSMNGYSTNYVSAGPGPADWLDPNAWTPIGTPLSTDNVTIDAGHTITISLNGGTCRDLTVDGTLSFTANRSIVVTGNYVVSATGSELAPVYGKITFNSPGTTLDVVGTSHSKLYYNFNSSRTILAGSVINKNLAITQISASKTITNLGNYTMGNCTPSTGTTWINGANSTLSLRLAGFMTGRTFTASAAGNTVILRYNTGALPSATGATFANLSLLATATGSKTLIANTIITENLTINTNNTLNSNNFNLTVGGNWTSSGTFTHTAGETVTFNGTSAQTMSNSVGTTTFKGITLSNSNGLTLTSGTYILDEVLTINDGTFNTGGRPFTMSSTATSTARIAPLGVTAAIAGNFTVQRHITARDTTFADLSSPVQSSTFSDWESELLFVSYVSSPPTSQATAATYDEVADVYVPVTSAGTFLAPGQGFEVFLSGGFSYTSFPVTTLTTVGVPNQGDHDLTSSISNSVQGWNLVGNPFASSISWASIFADAGTSGLEDYFEMYDFTIGDWNGFTSADGVEIGSTQGFWVYGLPGNGAVSLNIPETSKTTSSNSSLRTLAKPQPYFILNLASNTSKNAHNFKVAATSVASDGLESKDIPFRASPNKATPEMYCMVEGKKVNINNFNSSNESYSIPLKTKVNVSGKYTITASGFDFVSEYTCIKLQDKLTGQTIDLKEGEGNGYCFTMNANDYPDRFVLEFSKDANCKSAIVASSPNTDFNNQVEVLPSAQGNVINFNLSETTNTTISVLNVLGQTIVEGNNLDASSQSVNITLPEGFSGLYFVKIESSKGTITKKFVRK